MDKGPWCVGQIGCIASDDFTHDAIVKVTGDFATKEDYMAYCQWVRDALNAASKKEKDEIQKT